LTVCSKGSKSEHGDDDKLAKAKEELAKAQEELAKAEEDAHPKSSQQKKDDKPQAKKTRKNSKSSPKKKDEEDEADEQPKTPQKKARTGSKSEDKSQSKSGSTKSSSSSSSILEKGIIYFFIRGRVNIEDPSSVDEIQRTYIVLRPASSPDDAKPQPTSSHCRVLAVPKKVFPKTGRERWISFVEKAGVSLDDLKEKFLSGSEYQTKTRGTQHQPPAKPEGEGVYAITSTGRESHLCYILTRPEDLGEMQKKLGLKDKGSFIISTRNPEYPPPGGAGRLPEGPDFPEE
jgi:hypothetical protein